MKFALFGLAAALSASVALAQVSVGAVDPWSDIGPLGDGCSQVIDEGGDDGLAESPALMRGLDCDIDHLEEEAAITYDPAHLDSLAIPSNHHGADGVGQARGRALCRFR